MSAYDNITKAKAIWTLVLPEVVMPPDVTFFRWLRCTSLDTFEHAIASVPWRFQKHPNPEPIEIYKFVSAHLSWLRKRQEER